MTNYPQEMDSLLSPRSIAIIGASNTPFSTGHSLVANLLKLDYRGEIYPINPRTGEVQGIKAYPSIDQCPKKDVDLAVIAVKTPLVPEVLKQCADSGVKTALIVSDGFADGDVGGTELQQRVVDITRNRKIRVMGPNTQGFYNADEDLLVLTGSAIPAECMRKDGVSFVAQTGLFMGGWMVRGMTSEGIGMSKSIDLGNMCDVDHTDMLAYLGDDPSTRVIVLHMDRLDRGSEFARLARQITAHKPVIVVKSGKSHAAREAILSHTGSLAGDDSVFDAICDQAGMVRAADFDEVEDLVRTFLYLPPLTGKNIGIINFSGATGIIACDACSQFGLEVANLSESTIEKIGETLPSWASVKNPVDFMQSFEVDMRQTLTVALQALLADPKIDGIVLIVVTISMPPIDAYLSILKDLAGWELDKPISVWALADEESARQIQGLASNGVVAFPSVTRAVKAMAASYSRYRYLEPLGLEP